MIKNLSKYVRLGLMLAFIFIFNSCVTFKELEFKRIENVTVNELSQKGINVDILATIFNPNSFNIKIVDCDLDFYVGGTKIGKAVLDKLKIKKNLEKTYTIQLKAGPDQMSLGMNSLMNILLTQTAVIQVKGTIKARSTFATKKIPLDFQQRINL